MLSEMRTGRYRSEAGVRELVRYRYSLVRHRTSAKAQIHGVMAESGILPVVGDLWGPTGQAQLDRLELSEAYAMRLDSLRNLLDVSEHSIAELDAPIHGQVKADPGYQAVMTWPGGQGHRGDLRGRDR